MKKRRKKRNKYIMLVYGALFLSLLIILLSICMKFLLLMNSKVNNNNDLYLMNIEDKDINNTDLSKDNIELNEYVITNGKVDLYKYENNEYLYSGYIGKNIILHLNKVNKYYYLLKDLDGDYYVKKDNLLNYDYDVIVDDRYKKYIVFNYNVNTIDKTDFYDENGYLVYSINESMSLPIIIKDTYRYGVEYGNRLLYINAAEGDIVESKNTLEHNISGVATLNYHAFYASENAAEKSSCNTDICHSDKQFRSQLDYIKENNILSLKMKEMEQYIDGKIQLPKSVLITIDDGGMTKIAVDMLTEYKMYATIFLITSWFNPSDYYITDYIELHSHSHNMHGTGICPRGQGGGIQCLSEDKIQEDLKKSRELLNGTTYFCYPFYEYNDYSIEQLKKAGFTMAFAGESSKSDNLAKVGMDKFRVPRFVIVTSTSIEDLKNYFNKMK